jgi:hypothetical protein
MSLLKRTYPNTMPAAIDIRNDRTVKAELPVPVPSIDSSIPIIEQTSMTKEKVTKPPIIATTQGKTALPKNATTAPATMHKMPIIQGWEVRNLTHDVAEKIGQPRL